MVAPIMKSRLRLFALGRFSSTKIVEPAPIAEIRAPPRTIPDTRGGCAIFWRAAREKRRAQLRAFYSALFQSLEVHFEFIGLWLGRSRSCGLIL